MPTRRRVAPSTGTGASAAPATPSSAPASTGEAAARGAPRRRAPASPAPDLLLTHHAEPCDAKDPAGPGDAGRGDLRDRRGGAGPRHGAGALEPARHLRPRRRDLPGE